MAYTHISFNDESKPHGRALRSALRDLENAVDHLNDIKAAIEQMRDGDGSSAAHYARAQTLFGYENDAAAKASYDELASCTAKLNTDASVSSVNAAILQLLNKHR